MFPSFRRSTAGKLGIASFAYSKMEFASNAWVNMLKAAHKTSLIQDGKFRKLHP